MNQSSRSKPEILHLSRPTFWSKLSKTPISQDSRYSFVSTLVDISEESSIRNKSRPSVVKQHLISQLSPSVTELDVTSRETPYKENMMSRRSPMELESLLSNINPCKGSSRSTVRLTSLRSGEPEPVRLGNYLEYLGNGSNRNLMAFRSKMVAKMEPKRFAGGIKNWLDDLLPTEVKGAATSLNDISGRVNTIERSESEARKPIKKEQRAVESCIEAAIAGKLAEELARNFRVCRDSAENNPDIVQKVKEILEQEGVLPVFQRKLYKNLRLPVRIYRDMMEFREQDANGRVLSVERLASEQGEQMNILRKQGKVIRSRYHVYKRVNEKLEKLQSEFQVQKVKLLESNLLQAHESFRNKKNVILEKIAKVDEGRYQKMKAQCENMERLVPVHGEVGEETRKMVSLKKADGTRVSIDIRKLNKRLNRAVKNLQGNLLGVNNYR